MAFNRNYGESLECRRIVGGTVRVTGRDALRYRTHDHIDPGTEEWREYLDSLPAGALTAAYWPHFTLRPSLIRAGAVKALGRFDPASGHFERDFASRYAAAGHGTAFFDQINALHTGRRTWEGPDGGRLSAYDLIGDGTHPAGPARVETESTLAEGVEIAVINLDRRPDRWEAFERMARRVAGAGFLEHCRRVAAVDGAALESSDEIRHLFRGNDFEFRRGIVGCALSHMEVWRSHAAADGDDGALCLVLEDDVELGERFDRRLAEVCETLRAEHPEFDLALLLDYYADSQEAEAGEEGATRPRLVPARWERFLGGTSAYVISRKGARCLLRLVERDGVQNGIDTFLALKGQELEALECRPPIATAPVALAGNAVDSDIQHDYVPIDGEEPAPGRAAMADGVPSMSDLAPSFALAELRLEGDPRRRCSAMTISAENGGFRAMVRMTAAAGAHDAAEPLDCLVQLDDELRVTGCPRTRRPGGRRRLQRPTRSRRRAAPRGGKRRPPRG